MNKGGGGGRRPIFERNDHPCCCKLDQPSRTSCMRTSGRLTSPSSGVSGACALVPSLSSQRCLCGADNDSRQSCVVQGHGCTDGNNVGHLGQLAEAGESAMVAPLQIVLTASRLPGNASAVLDHLFHVEQPTMRTISRTAARASRRLAIHCRFAPISSDIVDSQTAMINIAH